MPDIKTALEKALAKTATAWAADDEAHQQIEPQQEKMVPTTAPTTTEKKDIPNASRITFEFIRDNPGLTNKQVTALLVAQGFKENTVSSLAYQMLRVRLIVADAEGRLTAVVREYVPIQTSLQRKKKAKPKAKAKPQTVSVPETITVSVSDPVPVPVPVVVATPEWTPNDVINTLTLPQAMALFKALRNILVG